MFDELARILLVASAAILPSWQEHASVPKVDEPSLRTADIGNGIALHYVEVGQGPPIVFVHGSLSDYEYWSDQIGPFSKHYRAFTYSRRYDYPNNNPARTGYSAVTDADDLARLIAVLGLGKVVVIGHSYGAFASLFLAAKRPDLVRALVLAEPPAVSLLQSLPGRDAQTGTALFQDIQRRMVAPMRKAFLEGETEAGVADFIDYVLDDPRAWSKLPESSRRQTLRNAHEWEIMMTTGTLFPELAPETVRSIRAPTLLLSGGKSYPFLRVITKELGRLLPNSETLTLPDAGHQMWAEDPEICRTAVEAFLERNGVVGHASSDLDGEVLFASRSYMMLWLPKSQGGNSGCVRCCEYRFPSRLEMRRQRPERSGLLLKKFWPSSNPRPHISSPTTMATAPGPSSST